MSDQNNNNLFMASLLIIGSFITILNQTLMITAIPPIMEEMDISANTGQWLTTVFMLVNGVMIPVSAFLIERFTTRQLFLTAMSVFTLGTILGAIAPNYPILIGARVIQSSGAGVMLPLMQTVFLMIFPYNKRGVAMGYIGLVISFAPAIGPALSGYITSEYSWRFLFVFILPIALAVIALGYFALRNVTEVKNPKLDPLSILLSSIGFGGLLYGFTSAGNYGWNSEITIGVLLVGVVALTIFIIRQLKVDNPMLEFRVFRSPTFTITTILGMVGFAGLIGSETLIPLFMQEMRDFTALESGLALLPGAVISGLMSPITGRIFDKIGARLLTIVGLSIVTGSSLLFSFLSIETTFITITVLYSVRMFGLSMIMMPATTAGLNQLPDKLIPHGTAMNNTMRQMAGSVGTAIFVTIMTKSQQSAENTPSIAHPDIHGVNVAFMVITGITLVAILLSFFVKKDDGSREKLSHIKRKEQQPQYKEGMQNA
ncbi:MDR family MFS transporter [Pontibacillus salicampi]|uniref:MDR family MFS transporter n=1 Tax=Pontibacillus salicampi TaxID=1449801 RepID=A0ABV6LMM0_9BACI